MRSLEGLEPRRLFDGGQLDTGFADQGVLTIDYAPVLQSNWVVATDDVTQDRNGYHLTVVQNVTPNDTPLQLYVTRHTPSGDLDTNFGEDGFATLERVSNFSTPEVATDGAARTYINDDAQIARLTTRGKYDVTFGRRGRAKVPYLDIIDKFEVDNEGQVYVFGSETVGTADQRMAVVRLTPTGKLDTDWADLGVFHAPLVGETNAVRDEAFEQLRLLDDGKIQLLGGGLARTATNDPKQQYVVSARVNAGGTPDTTYGDGGFAIDQRELDSGRTGSTRSLAIYPDGSALAFAADNNEDPESSGTPVRRNVKISADGATIDDEFHFLDDEAQTLFNSPVLEFGSAAPNGTIISTFDSTRYVRLRSDGSVDHTFADDGVLTLTNDIPKFRFANDGGILAIVEPDPRTSEATISRFWNDDRPVAQASVKDINASRSASAAINVVWRDDDGVEDGTLDSHDLAVVLPDGTRRSVRFIKSSSKSDGSVDALYKFSTADGLWNAADNGAYTIVSRGGDVADVNGARNGSVVIGSFAVSID